VSAPPGASGSQSNQSKPVSNAQSKPMSVNATGGRKLLSESCFYTGMCIRPRDPPPRAEVLAPPCVFSPFCLSLPPSKGFAGSQFLFNFDVCPYTEGGRGSRCCARGSNYGKCIPGNVRN
jgi:hypothetical protein